MDASSADAAHLPGGPAGPWRARPRRAPLPRALPPPPSSPPQAPLAQEPPGPAAAHVSCTCRMIREGLCFTVWQTQHGITSHAPGHTAFCHVLRETLHIKGASMQIESSQ